MTELALKALYTFAHPSRRRSTSFPVAAASSTAIRFVVSAMVATALIAASVGAPLLTLMTPPTPFARRVVAAEHAQDLAAAWEAAHVQVGAEHDSPLMRQWLATPPA